MSTTVETDETDTMQLDDPNNLKPATAGGATQDEVTRFRIAG